MGTQPTIQRVSAEVEVSGGSPRSREVASSEEFESPVQQAKHEISRKPEYPEIDAAEPRELMPKTKSVETDGLETDSGETGRSADGGFDLESVRLMVRGGGSESPSHSVRLVLEVSGKSRTVSEGSR